MADLSVGFRPDTPRARWAAIVLLKLLGLEARDAGAGDLPDLAYGGDGRCSIPAGPADGWDDPRPHVVRDGGLPIILRPGGPAAARGRSASELGFDALYAAYACLQGVWEKADPRDEVGTPIGASGWLAANGLLEVPLVHRYAEALGSALAAAGVPSRPRRPTIVPTHDVDRNFGHLFERRERAALLLRELRERRLSAARRAAGLIRRAIRSARNDPNDRFDECVALVSESGGRAAFFVASFGLFDAGSHRHDVPYDIEHEEVRTVLRKLCSRGAEIGVHLSLQARNSAEQVRRERERLAEVLGSDVRSARHHWWGLGPDPGATLRLHAEAGLEVDCSLGFNDVIGFRRGIAAPFRPFDPNTEAELPIVALPTIAMDAALFGSDLAYEVGLERLHAVAETIGKVGGSLVLDWHVHTFRPGALGDAAAALNELLRWAVGKGFRVATPLEAAGLA